MNNKLKKDLMMALCDTGLNRKTIADRSVSSYVTISRAIKNPKKSTMFTLDEIANALGYEIRLVKKGARIYGAF